MATTTVTITGNVHDLIDGDFDPRRTKVYLRHNTTYVVDPDAGVIRLGSATVSPASDGVFTLPDVIASVDTVDNLQATVYVDYADRFKQTQGKQRQPFGPYDLSEETGTVDLTELDEVQHLDASFVSVTMAQMQDLLDAMEEISGLTGEDDAVALLVNTPSSDTAAALTASTADIMAAVDADTASTFREQQEARWNVRGETIRPSDFSGTTAREKLQQVVDFYVAIGYDKSIVLDAVYDLRGGGQPYQTIFLYGNGGAGLTSYSLTYDGQTTGSISGTASEAAVLAALEALPNVGVGDVAVARSGTGGTDFDNLAAPPYSYAVTFQGALANTTHVLTATPTGGTGTVTVKASQISLEKVNWHDRDELVFLGIAGGGIIADDEGSVFTTDIPNTGDITFDGVKFFSTSGSGTSLIDGDKLIRVTLRGCLFRDWDHGVTQLVRWRWLQSFTMDRATKVIGGSDMFIYPTQTFDCTLSGLIEDRNGGFFGNTTAMTTLANRVLRILGPNIENCSGIPIQLAFSGDLVLEDIYLEQNGGPTDPQIDFWTLAPGARHVGVTIKNCMPQQTAAQKANHVGAILVGNNVGADEWITSIQNWMDGGIMYQFASASGLVYGSGDKVESGGYVVYPGQENQYISAVRKSYTTANLPKSVRTGTSLQPTQPFDSTRGKYVTATAIGTKAQFTLRFSAGATASGNITVTLLGVPYVVAVTAGDTITQVRDKVVAAATSFFPVWRPRASSTDIVAFDALTPGAVADSKSFSAAATGVTQNYLALDVAGTDPTWSIPATTAEVAVETAARIADVDAEEAARIAGDAATLAAATAAVASPFGFNFTVDPGIVRSSDTLGVTANQGIYMRVRDAATISKIGLSVGVQSGNISVAVYQNSGTGRAAVPGTRLATSGAVACPATGYQEVPLGASVAMAPGDWIGISADNATAKFTSLLAAVATTDLGKGRQYAQGSAHPLPSTPSALSASVGFTFVLIGVP